MDNYKLVKNNGDIIKRGNHVEVMQELFDIIKDTKSGVKEIKCNSRFNGTEFVLEGMYCDFSVIIVRG